MERPQSETHGAWEVAPATVDARRTWEKHEHSEIRKLYSACARSTDPAVREAYGRVVMAESGSRFLGGKGLLADVLTGAV